MNDNNKLSYIGDDPPSKWYIIWDGHQRKISNKYMSIVGMYTEEETVKYIIVKCEKMVNG